MTSYVWAARWGAGRVSDWRPDATLATIRARAELYYSLREWFHSAGVLEVETPILGDYGVTDPNLSNLEVFSRTTSQNWFLETSPEYAMKRLLAAGIGDCYQIHRACRDDEIGRHHQPEFSLLEWYRQGYDLDAIVAETAAIISLALDRSLPISSYRYADLFAEATGLNLYDASDETLGKRCKELGLQGDFSRDALVGLLLDSLAVKHFPAYEISIITHYPASQAALARIDPDDSRSALRFEAFVGSMELANGFVELTSAEEQAARFASDNESRVNADQPTRKPDTKLLAALEHGLPDCAGVALGLDRLLMLCCNVSEINQVATFAHAPQSPDC